MATKIYQAQFNNRSIIAMVMSIHAYNHGSNIKGGLFKTTKGYNLRIVDERYVNTSFLGCSDKSYKTLAGAMKSLLKQLNELQNPHIDFYINQECISALPAKLPEIMVNAQQSELTHFNVGIKYLDDMGNAYLMVERQVNNGIWMKFYADGSRTAKYIAERKYEFAHVAMPEGVVMYDKGVEVIVITNGNGVYITTIRSDKPVNI